MRICDIDALFWSLQTAIGECEESPVDNLKTYICLNSDENCDSKNIYTLLVIFDHVIFQAIEINTFYFR